MVTMEMFAREAKRWKWGLSKLENLPFEDGLANRRDFAKRTSQRAYAKNTIPYRSVLRQYLRWTKPEWFKREAEPNDAPCHVCGQRVLGPKGKKYCSGPCKKRAKTLGL